jgi:hypothetical protein
MWETGELYTGFRWGNLRERDQLGVLGVDGRITLNWDFNMAAYIGLITLRIGICSEGL